MSQDFYCEECDETIEHTGNQILQIRCPECLKWTAEELRSNSHEELKVLEYS